MIGFRCGPSLRQEQVQKRTFRLRLVQRLTCIYCGARIPNEGYRSDDREMRRVWIRLGRPCATKCNQFCLCCRQRLMKPLTKERKKMLMALIARLVEMGKRKKPESKEPEPVHAGHGNGQGGEIVDFELGNVAIYSAHCDTCGWKADNRRYSVAGVYFQRPAAEYIVATDHRNEGKCAEKVVITALEIRMER